MFFRSSPNRLTKTHLTLEVTLILKASSCFKNTVISEIFLFILFKEEKFVLRNDPNFKTLSHESEKEQLFNGGLFQKLLIGFKPSSLGCQGPVGFYKKALFQMISLKFYKLK